MPAITILFAGTKNFCPGTRMARSYNTRSLMPNYYARMSSPALKIIGVLQIEPKRL